MGGFEHTRLRVSDCVHDSMTGVGVQLRPCYNSLRCSRPDWRNRKMLKTFYNFADQFRQIGAAETHKRGGNTVMFHIWMDMLVMRMGAL
jgi:hypothetical protein